MLPISLGISPVNLLWDKFKEHNPMRLNIWGGIVPDKLLLDMSIKLMKCRFLPYSDTWPFVTNSRLSSNV
uniref:Uncharacterized protein n=1 Tax=Cajanus cajan TaxID=3821 RepID=A0A151S8E7_CAJCA|nr:hypothetical protein KK1_027082 [Cajanus cajan]